MNKKEPEQYTPDLEVAKYLNLVSFRYDMFHAINYPVQLSGYAVIVLQILFSIPIRLTNSFVILDNHFVQDGLDYYKMSSDFLLPHTRAYGISDRFRLSKLIKEILDFPTPLVIAHTKYINNKRYRYFAFTEYTRKMFDTENYDIVRVAKEIDKPESETEEQPDNNNDDLEVLSETGKNQVDEFPEWFDRQWEILKESGNFKNCNKMKGSKPVGYAIDFAKAVQQLVDKTLYEGIGKSIKDQSISIPDDLTVKDVVNSILTMGGTFDNPLEAIVTTVWLRERGNSKPKISQCYSPLLKHWGRTSSPTKAPPKSSGRSVRSNVQYTEEDYKSNKKVMYTYDYIKSYLPNGMVDELVYGDISDYWFKQHPFAKKYDNRLTNLCMDFTEAYNDAKMHKPSMSKVLDTLIDMAQFKTKGTENKWEDLFWEYVDQMPIYQDHGLWKWFVERFYQIYGERICDMYKDNDERAQALERAAQLRSIESSAFGYDD